MVTFNSMKINKNAIDGGVWMDYDGAKFLVRPLHSVEMNKAQIKIASELGIDDAKNLLDRPEYIKVFCELVLVDWENIEDENGDAVPYSSEYAYEVLSEEGFIPLYIALTLFAADASNYKGDIDGERLGKCETLPSGTRNTRGKKRKNSKK